jgi:hypothetical protein
MGRPLPIAEPGSGRTDPLERDGWERRFMAVGSRLEEAVALYRQLGFVVRLELPSAEDLREECSDCRLALELYRILYTRRTP